MIQLKNGLGDNRREVELNPTLVKYLPIWDQLQVQNQRLVRIPLANSDAASVVQVVLPRSLVPGVLSMLHNTPTGGHLGIQKLQAKVKDHFYWLGWFGDVKKNGVGSVMILHLARLMERLYVPLFRCLLCPIHMSMWL